MIKKIAFNFIYQFYRIKFYAAESKLINEKLNYLKKKNKFKRFPIDKDKPVISKYPNFSKTDRKWLDFFYSSNGIVDIEYIPLTYYYNFIEPCLNDQPLLSSLQDKNFYEIYFKEIKTPKTVLRRINGFFYNNKYEQILPDDKIVTDLFSNYNSVILKPSLDSGSGKHILLFERQDNYYKLKSGSDELNLNFLQNYGRDFIIQEFVKQHQFFKRFNPSSNNTLRVFTYRSVKDDQINILHILLRIGKSGSFLDHDNLGGVGISIKGNNYFDEFAYNNNGDRYKSVNEINFSQQGKVPFIDELKEVSVKIAQNIFYARLLAMDFTIDEDGNIILVEINCWGNGITQYQMNNGSLFGKFTTEILEYCYNISNNKISITPHIGINKHN